jgi:hypothetical protein
MLIFAATLLSSCKMHIRLSNARGGSQYILGSKMKQNQHDELSRTSLNERFLSRETSRIIEQERKSRYMVKKQVIPQSPSRLYFSKVVSLWLSRTGSNNRICKPRKGRGSVRGYSRITTIREQPRLSALPCHLR